MAGSQGARERRLLAGGTSLGSRRRQQPRLSGPVIRCPFSFSRFPLPRTNDSKRATEQGKHAMPATEASDRRRAGGRPAGRPRKVKKRERRAEEGSVSREPWAVGSRARPPMGTEAAAHGHMPCCWCRARGGRDGRRGGPRPSVDVEGGFHRPPRHVRRGADSRAVTRGQHE